MCLLQRILYGLHVERSQRTQVYHLKISDTSQTDGIYACLKFLRETLQITYLVIPSLSLLCISICWSDFLNLSRGTYTTFGGGNTHKKRNNRPQFQFFALQAQWLLRVLTGHPLNSWPQWHAHPAFRSLPFQLEWQNSRTALREWPETTARKVAHSPRRSLKTIKVIAKSRFQFDFIKKWFPTAKLYRIAHDYSPNHYRERFNNYNTSYSNRWRLLKLTNERSSLTVRSRLVTVTSPWQRRPLIQGPASVNEKKSGISSEMPTAPTKTIHTSLPLTDPGHLLSRVVIIWTG